MPCELCHDCPITTVRYILQGNGVKQFTYQCTVCGEQIGAYLPYKHHDVMQLSDYVPFDYDFRQQMRQNRRNNLVMTERFQAYYANPDEVESRPDYYQYIQSPEWKARAQLVMNRAQRICEGCRENRAAEVHHLTYVHLGHEFLWELVAVCRECHARFHRKETP